MLEKAYNTKNQQSTNRNQPFKLDNYIYIL